MASMRRMLAATVALCACALCCAAQDTNQVAAAPAPSTNQVEAAQAPVAAEAVLIETPSIKQLEVPKSIVPLHGKMELKAQIVPGYGNPFDPDDVSVEARLTSPSGKKITAPAFLYARKVGTAELDDWRVRFSPQEIGDWEGELIVVTPEGKQDSDSFEFKCMLPAFPQPIRVSRRDPTLFEKTDGSYFYPIGYNVCWAHPVDYRFHFQKMREHGANWSRIWIAAWNYDIEWSKVKGCEGIGRYNLKRAESFDEIIKSAESNSIYLQLVLHEHCRLATQWNPEWQNNPYNKELGGPLENPADFFTDAEARRLAKNRMRYIIARWGYSTSVMAWELWNEVNLTDDFNQKNDTAWHREMAQYIRKTDPQKRMITTSYANTPNGDVFSLPEIDFTQLHMYDEDIVGRFVEWNRAFAQFKKPFFIGEFGRNSTDGIDRKDRQGMFLHTGIWAQFMTPGGGNAMSWWWYDLIKPKNLFYRFGSLSDFARGIDRRRGPWRWQTGRTAKGAEAPRVLSMSSPRLVMLYAYDPKILPYTEKLPETLPGLEAEVTIEDMAPGKWMVRAYEPYLSHGQNRVVPRMETVGADGLLVLPIKTAGPDFAYRIDLTAREKATSSQLPSLKLEAFEGAPAEAPPRPQFRIKKAGRSIQIDGDTAEWAGLEFTGVAPKDGRKPESGSFRFAVCHDDQNLYVACEVTDDQFVRQKKGGDIWRDDCVELWIDSKHDATKFNNMPTNPGLFQINIAPAAESEGEVEIVMFRNPKPPASLQKSIRAASRRTPTGYTMEIAVPLAELRGTDPAQKLLIGFNISICDADKAGNKTDWYHVLWAGTKEDDATQWSDATLE